MYGVEYTPVRQRTGPPSAAARKLLDFAHTDTVCLLFSLTGTDGVRVKSRGIKRRSLNGL